jgi:uncharacterized protein
MNYIKMVDMQNRVEFEKQDWFIERMQKLGYKPDSKGVCFGIAHMGMQAVLANDIETFDRRIKKIHEISADELGNEIEKVRLKSKNKETLTEDEEIILSIPAFFDSLEIYCRINSLKHLLGENQKEFRKFIDAEETSVIVSPKKLEDEVNQGLQRVDTFSGAYTFDELKQYFESIQSELESDPSLSHPITISFGSINHVISLGYNHSDKAWTFINANYLPSKKTTSYEDPQRSLKMTHLC